MTHAYTTPATQPIAVDLVVDGTTYPGVGGSQSAVSVDMTDATTTTLAVTPASPTFGESVQLTATVAAAVPATGIPTGTVEFYDGTIDLGPGTFAPNTLMATLTTPLLTAGSHSFTAVYSGDGTFDQSTSAVVAATASYPVLAGAVTLAGAATAAKATSLDLPQHDPSGNAISHGRSIGATAWSRASAAIPRRRRTNMETAPTIIRSRRLPPVRRQLPGYVAGEHFGRRPQRACPDGQRFCYSGSDAVTLSGTFANNSPQESLGVSIDWGDGSQPATFSLAPVRQVSSIRPAIPFARAGTRSPSRSPTATISRPRVPSASTTRTPGRWA